MESHHAFMIRLLATGKRKNRRDGHETSRNSSINFDTIFITLTSALVGGPLCIDDCLGITGKISE